MNNQMGNNEGNLQDTLNERGSVYGNYDEVLRTRASIMNTIKAHHRVKNGHEMSQETEIGFSDIVLKLVRASGSPNYSDSFHDLAGYATLMEERANRINFRKS